jgi:hypothetical protein
MQAIKSEIKSGEDELLRSFQSLNVVGNSINDIVEKQVIQRDNYDAIVDKVKLDSDNLKQTLADLHKHNQDLKIMKKMNLFLSTFNKLSSQSSVEDKEAEDGRLLRKSIFIHEIGNYSRSWFPLIPVSLHQSTDSICRQGS